MIQRHTFEATEFGVYTPGQRVIIPMPKSGYITHIDALFRFNIENIDNLGANMPLAEDGASRLIQSMRLRAAGSRNYYDITDGRQWLFRNIWNYKNQMGMGMLPQVGDANVVATDYFFMMRMHWGYNFYNLYDTTGAVPAAELQDLVLEITWNPFVSAYPTAVAGVDYNINASEVKLSVYELTFSGADRPSDVWEEGIPRPRIQSQIETVKGVHSNLGLEIDLPVGDTIFQTVVLAVNNTTGNRQDGVGTITASGPTELGVKFPRETATKWQLTWEQFKQLSKVQAEVAEFSSSGAAPGINTRVPYVGAGIMRWADVTNRGTGLDLTAAQQGDVKMGFTMAHDGANDCVLHLLHFMAGVAEGS